MSIGRADIAGDTSEYTPSVDAVVNSLCKPAPSAHSTAAA